MRLSWNWLLDECGDEEGRDDMLKDKLDIYIPIVFIELPILSLNS